MVKSKKAKTDYTKIILVVLIAILALGLYFFYGDIVQKNSVIDSQNKTIHTLNGIIEQEAQKITGLETSVNSLQANVSFLKLESTNLKTQLTQTKNLLGQKQNEVEELKPTVKNYFAVGVDKDGVGTVIPMNVKISKGTGILSVNIKGVELQSGATSSIRTASEVASNITHIDLLQKDISVNFINEEGNILFLDGESAGSAVAVTMIAALENKNLDTNSMMTGTIDINGIIGKVGEVLAKARAAKDYGASKFYVPVGESVSVSGLNVTEVINIDKAIDLIIK